MNDETIAALARLNAAFYARAARAFSRTREAPWPGWRRLFELVGAATPPRTILDAGCGNGRFLLAAADALPHPLAYLGLDTSPALLEDARAKLAPLAAAGHVAPLELAHVDVTADGALAPYPPQDLVVAMGLLHHVAARRRREALVESLAERTAPGGWLALTVWRFAERPRFEAMVVPWSAHPEIDPTELEPGDVLLRFDREGARYCHALDAEEEAGLESVATRAGLELIVRYTADGAEGDLNRYTLFRRT